MKPGFLNVWIKSYGMQYCFFAISLVMNSNKTKNIGELKRFITANLWQICAERLTAFEAPTGSGGNRKVPFR